MSFTTVLRVWPYTKPFGEISPEEDFCTCSSWTEPGEYRRTCWPAPRAEPELVRCDLDSGGRLEPPYSTRQVQPPGLGESNRFMKARP